MNYSFTERKQVQVLEVHSLFDEFDNKVILKEVESRIVSGKNSFIVDLAKLDFMNSIGINLLLSILKKLHHSGGKLAVASASAHIEKLLELTRLKSIFNLQPSVEEALVLIDQ